GGGAEQTFRCLRRVRYGTGHGPGGRGPRRTVGSARRCSAVDFAPHAPDLTALSMERKTLDQRAQMTDLERLRHSAAHVMATAIAKLWPDAQFAAGPPVEDGFYYDVDL